MQSRTNSGSSVPPGLEKVPPQRLLDYFTRVDELLLANLDVMNRLIQVMSRDGGGIAAPISSVELKKSLEIGATIPYSIISKAMDTAGDDELVTVDGTSLVSATDGTLEGCYVRFNNKQFDRSPLAHFDWDTPFFKIYLTWPAQAGKTLYLAVGRQVGVKGSARQLGMYIGLAPETIYNAMPAASPSYSSMVDFRNAKRIVIHATSTLDAAVTLQVIGNTIDSTTEACDIDGALPLAAGSVATQYLSVGLAWDDWHPYVGIEITYAVAPTAGTLLISAVRQE